jgi:hypothetical protein
VIRLTCPDCQTRLNARAALAGQTRKCPKCGTPIQIPEAAEDELDDLDGLDEAAPDQHVHDLLEEELPHIAIPERLNRLNHYFVCDKRHIFATWQDNAKGWMIRAGAGFIAARRHKEELPNEGEFQLVEMVLDHTDEGLRLSGIRVLDLSKRYATLALERGDNAILEKVVGPGSLNREQKNAVRDRMAKLFMPEVWRSCRKVMDYLANEDYHSPGTEPAE